MDGRVAFAFTVFLIFLFVVGLVGADGDDTTMYEVGATQENIETAIGNITLYNGTLIGGNFSNSTTLIRQYEIFTTTEGWRTFADGTIVSCDPIAPGHPDPCQPY